MLLVTVPLYLLYEVSIIVARKVEKFRGNRLDVSKSGLTVRCFFLSEIPKRVWYYLSGTMTYGYLFMSHSRIFTSKGVRVMDESMRRILYLSLTEAGAVSQQDSAICT